MVTPIASISIAPMTGETAFSFFRRLLSIHYSIQYPNLIFSMIIIITFMDKNLSSNLILAFFSHFLKSRAAYRAVISLREPALAPKTEFLPENDIPDLFLTRRHDLYSKVNGSVLDCIIIRYQNCLFFS